MNEGINGSPFKLIFDGTTKPELIYQTTDKLMTGSTYLFKLQAMNQIHDSP